jgi:hypothetical protein
MYWQTPQERTYAVNSLIVGFTGTSHLLGSWEDDPASITVATPAEVFAEDIGLDPLAEGMLVVWPWHSLTLAGPHQVFDLLVDRWIEDTNLLSSTTEIVTSWAYQSIIAMGPGVVPLILKQLEREGDQPRNWFWALRYLTRENPVRSEQRGNRRAMAQAWLEWGRYRYVW